MLEKKIWKEIASPLLPSILMIVGQKQCRILGLCFAVLEKFNGGRP